MNDPTLVFWEDILQDIDNDPAKLRDFVRECIAESIYALERAQQLESERT